ncbi:hypothetical protein E4T39_03939 [Aureobasidium subglaciale]|nr:hypothetical protein E4T39_03939 [Aureobasidium subglaciale]
MATKQKFDLVLLRQMQQKLMRPSSELGSPVSSRIIQVLQSSPVPDTPLPDNDSLFWDSMSLPSSPSPKRKSEPTANLDRWSSRGFSEDVGLPPRQIEKLFKSLDLPPEIRNMIYVEALGCFSHYWYFDHQCSDDCYCLVISPRMWWILQWRPPPLAMASKQLRQESMPLYYAHNDFVVRWDPESPCDQFGNNTLKASVTILKNGLDFLETHNLWLRSITICDNDYSGYWGPWSIKELLPSVRMLAPLRRAVNSTGRPHPALGCIKSDGMSTVGKRIFELAGKLRPEVLGSTRRLEERVRRYLHRRVDTRPFLYAIEEREEENRGQGLCARAGRKEDRRLQNIVKGEERWSGVLRSRPAKEER